MGVVRTSERAPVAASRNIGIFSQVASGPQIGLVTELSAHLIRVRVGVRAGAVSTIFAKKGAA